MFIARKYTIKVYEDVGTVEYDLTNRQGPHVVYQRMAGETFEDTQKRLLFYLNQKLDIFRLENSTIFGIKGDGIYQEPKERASIMESTNIYKMIIPTLPDSWLPTATLNPLFNQLLQICYSDTISCVSHTGS
jgi:hypothetical protein